MTSGADDKALWAQGVSGRDGPQDNILALTPKARIEMVRKRSAAKPPAHDQKAAPPVHDGNDDPGPSAA